ncbi:MAG: hypothetical protein KDD60_08650, partial [Bdellovibrionales bacterium]|nr:hypothetical protein [Bdellovibrionales bacterium]
MLSYAILIACILATSLAATQFLGKRIAGKAWCKQTASMYWKNASNTSRNQAGLEPIWDERWWNE